MLMVYFFYTLVAYLSISAFFKITDHVLLICISVAAAAAIVFKFYMNFHSIIDQAKSFRNYLHRFEQFKKIEEKILSCLVGPLPNQFIKMFQNQCSEQKASSSEKPLKKKNDSLNPSPNDNRIAQTYKQNNQKDSSTNLSEHTFAGLPNHLAKYGSFNNTPLLSQNVSRIESG